jgi:hypothetical protein
MLPSTFFRISIALPIILPLLMFPFGANIVSGFLILSLFFGGVQYVLFAIWLFFAIGKKKSSAEIRYLSFRAPLLFVPLQIIGWFLWLSYKGRSNLELAGVYLVCRFHHSDRLLLCRNHQCLVRYMQEERNYPGTLVHSSSILICSNSPGWGSHPLASLTPINCHRAVAGKKFR